MGPPNCAGRRTGQRAREHSRGRAATPPHVFPTPLLRLRHRVSLWCSPTGNNQAKKHGRSHDGGREAKALGAYNSPGSGTIHPGPQRDPTLPPTPEEAEAARGGSAGPPLTAPAPPPPPLAPQLRSQLCFRSSFPASLRVESAPPTTPPPALQPGGCAVARSRTSRVPGLAALRCHRLLLLRRRPPARLAVRRGRRREEEKKRSGAAARRLLRHRPRLGPPGSRGQGAVGAASRPEPRWLLGAARLGATYSALPRRGAQRGPRGCPSAGLVPHIHHSVSALSQGSPYSCLHRFSFGRSFPGNSGHRRRRGRTAISQPRGCSAARICARGPAQPEICFLKAAPSPDLLLSGKTQQHRPLPPAGAPRRSQRGRCAHPCPPRRLSLLYLPHPTDLLKGTHFGVPFVIHNAPLNDTHRSFPGPNHETGFLRMEKATSVAAAA